ncbi:MAG TPA: carboxypeptidase-like regulatory domain-containing protein [Candidatus Acidoferrales bacterium]|nr:carboxypeptidase-like regulatory domain-containing protein [Candidatus Acidoferrales bacterium]
MKRFTSIGAVLLLIAVLSGCAGGSSGSIPSTTQTQSRQSTSKGSSSSGWIEKAGTKHDQDTLGGGPLGAVLAILLGDAQPVIANLNVAQINLGVDAVNVVYEGQVTTIATYSTPNIVNVMANGGNPSSIGIGQLYTGSYDHIQFVIDTGTSNVVDTSGNVYPIQFQVGAASQSSAGAGQMSATTGSATTVTVTVGGAFMIGGSPAASILADFNALESLNRNSSGQIVAQPTLYAVGAGNAAEIQGQVLSNSGQPVQNAVVVGLITLNSGKVVVANTTNTDVNGNFDLHAINAGSYQLVVYNTYTTASGQTITAQGADASAGASFQGPSLTAPAGQITQVGTLND